MEQIFKALTQLIKNNDNIYIMTHRNPDFDGMGSAIGLQQIIYSFKKESYIIFNNKEKNTSLAKSYDLLKGKELYFNTISKVKALNSIKEDSLLIILGVFNFLDFILISSFNLIASIGLTLEALLAGK